MLLRQTNFYVEEKLAPEAGVRLDVAEANQLPRKVVANHNGLWLDKEHDVDRHTGGPRGDKAFYDELFDALDAYIQRGADPELMVAVLGTKLAEVLARCLHGSRLSRPQGEA